MHRSTIRRWVENGVEVVKEFVYKLPFDWHFRYRHAVDDHNNLRHGLPSIEDTWITQRWEVSVFAFILAVCEVNAFLVVRYFQHGNSRDTAPKLLTFRRQLAWQLINNPYLENDEAQNQMVLIGTAHTLLRAPTFASAYRNRGWERLAKQKYQQYKCGRNCGRRVRTYCPCNPTKWLCAQCFGNHCLEASQEA